MNSEQAKEYGIIDEIIIARGRLYNTKKGELSDKKK